MNIDRRRLPHLIFVVALLLAGATLLTLSAAGGWTDKGDLALGALSILFAIGILLALRREPRQK
jgi:hypothetical protein